MAIFSTVIPAFLLSAGMSRIGTNKTVILTSIGPLSTIGLAAVFLGEAVSLSQMAGTVLVLAGVLQLTFDKEGTKQHNAVSIDELSTPGEVKDSGRR
jgi:drug/metabolite transporter (DMT)-like permease